MTTEQMLPGMEGFAPEMPPVSEELESTVAQVAAGVPPSPLPSRLRPRALLWCVFAFALAATVGVAGVAAYRLIPAPPPPPAPVEPPREPDAIPYAILRGEEDIAAWKTVRNMRGQIGDVLLSFTNGCAVSRGVAYRVQLDFCPHDGATLARVCGNGNWVVQVDAEGHILKSYPSPARAKTLRELLLGDH